MIHRSCCLPQNNLQAGVEISMGHSTFQQETQHVLNCSADDDSCFSDDSFWDEEAKTCHPWIYVTREPVGRVAACWLPHRDHAGAKMQKRLDLAQKQGIKHVKGWPIDVAAGRPHTCHFCAGVHRRFVENHGCYNESETMEDYIDFPLHGTDPISNSATWMLAPEHAKVTDHPDLAMALAKRRLRHFDLVVPVERLFDGMKHLSHVMNRPLPKQITNMRTMRSVCGKFMSNFTTDYRDALQRNESFDCTGKARACYAEKNAVLKKSDPVKCKDAASGHSLRVSQAVRKQNSLDEELHSYSSELWEAQWTRLRELEGEPLCNVACPAELLEKLCHHGATVKMNEIGDSFDSDAFRASGGPLSMRCFPSLGGKADYKKFQGKKRGIQGGEGILICLGGIRF